MGNVAVTVLLSKAQINKNIPVRYKAMDRKLFLAALALAGSE
ncbi:MAG: hypothetical protein ABII93_00595 [Chrysiogenia bacterium]